MTPDEIYQSPDGKVLVTNFDGDATSNIDYYQLEVGKWYQMGLKDTGPNSDDFIWVIHDDYKHIPHLPKNFMTKVEWRQKKLHDIGI